MAAKMARFLYVTGQNIRLKGFVNPYFRKIFRGLVKSWKCVSLFTKRTRPVGLTQGTGLL